MAANEEEYKSNIKMRNTAVNDALKQESSRYKSHKEMVDEWASSHNRFPGDVAIVRQGVNHLHKTIVDLVNRTPIGDSNVIDVYMDSVYDETIKQIDLIEDSMFQIAEKELNEARAEAQRYRAERDDKHAKSVAERKAKVEAAQKALLEAKLEEERKAEELRKKREAEERERKNIALSTEIDDDVIVMNMSCVNNNLLSLNCRLASMLKRNNYSSVTLAKTKDGSLVLVCNKDATCNYFVNFNVRDNKTRASIVSSNMCKVVRKVYNLEENKEYLLHVRYVEYKEDVKVKIIGIKN